jgi:AcrR family transcriptional regulator
MTRSESARGRNGSGAAASRNPAQRRNANSRPRNQASDPKLRTRPPGRLPTGRHGLTPEEVRESQKQRLMNAMAELASSKGYHETTIAELVTRAGVSRATYYELFEDKEQCFVETMKEAARLLRENLYPLLAEDVGDWDAQVEAVVDRLLRALTEYRTYAITAIVESLAGGEEAYEMYRTGTGLLMQLLRLGRQYVPEDLDLPECTERVIVGGGEWMIAGELIAGRAERLPDLIADYVYIATVPYLGQEEALRRMSAARDRLREAAAA